MIRTCRLVAMFTCCCCCTLLVAAAAGCKKDGGGTSTSGGEKVLNVYIWSDYLPDAVVQDFTARTGIKVNVALFSSNEELQTKLRSGVTDYDVVVPSDYMVRRLIAAKLVRPLDRSKLTRFSNLDPHFLDQKFDPGNAYSIPYSWGTTGIGFNKAKAGPVDSWSAVFDPKFGGQVLMLNDAREAFAAALRVMGKSPNETDPAALAQAAEMLKRQKPLVKLYDSDRFHEALAAGDVTVAQGFNGQFAKVIAEKPAELAFVIPKEGGTFWSDNLCVAAGAQHVDAAHAFLDYVLDPEVAARIANETSYATPNAAAKRLVKDELRNNPIIYPPEDVLSRCQFMEDAGEAAKLIERYMTDIKAE